MCSNILTLSLLTGLMLCGAVSAADTKLGRTLLREDFDQDGCAGFAAAALEHEHIEPAEGAGPDGSDAIRVTYAGYEYGSRRVLVDYPLDAGVESATLSFDVCFEKDFQWALGGKLHGLGPKHPVTGGRERQPYGWSARIMFNSDGRCSTYLYDQQKNYQYGIGDHSKQPVFIAGKWHHVVLLLQLNAPGKPNGFARVFVDNRPVVSSGNVVFRGTGGPATLIQQFLFCTFHGGHEPSWTPVDDEGNPTTVYACFDNIHVTEGIRQD